MHRIHGMLLFALISFLFCGSALSAPAEANSKIPEVIVGEMSKIPPLDTVTPFAGFAAAIAIAYASLPNYRHKKAVQDKIHEIVRLHSLLTYMKQGSTVNTVLCASENWAILFHFGMMRDTYPELLPQPGAGKYYLNRVKPGAYTLFFQNNLDKMICIFLGFISVAILWFSLYDDVHFFDASTKNYLRIFFLIDIEAYFVISLIMIVGLSIVYMFIHDRTANHHRPYHKIWPFYLTFFLTSSLMIVYSCWNLPILSFFSHAYITAQTLHVYRYIQLSLIFSAVLPAAMWGIGNYLSHHIISTSEDCARNIVAMIGAAPSTATLPQLPQP